MAFNNFDRIAAEAEALLEKCGISAAPVKMDTIAQYLGLQLEPTMMDSETSGMLVLKNGKGIIGFNHQDPENRKRFTIAHEIGHFLLHKSEDDLFLDKGNGVGVFFRSPEVSREETEANVFAANLLMPADLVIKAADQYFVIGEEETEELARKFKVSVMAMSYRLQNLNIR